MSDLNLNFLSIDVVKGCNLSCVSCGDFSSDRERSYIPAGDVRDILAYVAPHVKSEFARFSGGEPLLHPNLLDIISLFLKRFKRVEIATNGLLLPSIHDKVDDRVLFLVTRYKGVNDHIFSAKWEARVVPINVQRWINADYDPDHDEDAAKVIYTSCPYRMVKVALGKVYACCHGEAVRFKHGVDTGVDMWPGWREELAEVENWRACQHCFIAGGNEA